MLRIPYFKPMIFIVILVVACSGVALAQNPPSQEPSDPSHLKAISGKLQTIKDFATEQRAEAVKQAKIALEEMDAAIESLEAKIDRNWEKMDQAARKKARETLKALKKQRNELAEWYGGLKHASSKAWGHVKGGLLKSYESLGEAFRKAEKEFE